MKKEKKVILTFDYELFLGSDSGSLSTSLLIPASRILKVLNKYQQKAIFFIDAPFLLFLRENNPLSFNLVKEQLLEILNSGSYIGLHIHPQWQDAVQINDQRWSFTSFDKYRFHSLSNTEQETLFKQSFILLDSIIKSGSFTQRSLMHFRAGGWSVQPFAIFKNYFTEYGILFDFSVKSGFSINKMPYHYFDYSSVNRYSENWTFQNTPELEEIPGAFTEYPLASDRVFGLLYILNRFFLNKHWFGNGKGLSQSVEDYTSHNSIIKKYNNHPLGLGVGLNFATKNSVFSI